MYLSIGTKDDFMKEMGLKGDLYEDSKIAWHTGFGKLMKAYKGVWGKYKARSGTRLRMKFTTMQKASTKSIHHLDLNPSA